MGSEALHLSLGQGWKNSLGTGDGKRSWLSRFGHGRFPGGTFLRPHDHEVHNTPLRSRTARLGKTAVDKQFHSRDVATVIRCEKHHCPSNFVRLAKPAERYCAGYHLATLLTRVTRGEQIIQTGRINGSGAYRIDTKTTTLEFY